MVIFKRLTTFFSKNYWIFLFIVVFISYGQILNMYVWKDDNAIFFKFNHLEEPAGYLGRGLLGEGVYRFSVTPYWFVYQIFGYETIVPYYLICFLAYLLATYLVYLFTRNFISETSGKVASFLFASGYIASEGITWLASSMILSLSVTLILLILYFYTIYFKKRKVKYYFFALLFFGVASYLTIVRIHYFILVLFMFEILFVVKRGDYKAYFYFLARIIPFFIIFFIFIIQNSDQRALSTVSLIKDIASGDFYKSNSTFGSLGYLFIPDQQVFIVSNFINKLQITVGKFFVELLILIINLFFMFQINKKNIKGFYIACFIILNFTWMWLSFNISNSPQINSDTANTIANFVGGLVIQDLILLCLISKGLLKKYLFFFTIWIITSLLVYTAYIPTSIFLSTDRYLLHSFLAMAILLALLFFRKIDNPYKKLIAVFIILLGIVNITNSLIYQRKIIIERSLPAKKFYTDLKNYLPVLKKGDIVFIDIAENAIRQYEAAFSVGQMPETTALAWRYGLDRYDFILVNDFNSLVYNIKSKNISPKNIHTFFYSKNKLIDTTDRMKKYLFTDKSDQAINLKLSDFDNHNFLSNMKTRELPIMLKEPIDSLTPLKLNLKLKASVVEFAEKDFPIYLDGNNQNSIYRDLNKRLLSLEYKKNKLKFAENSDYIVSSEWSDRRGSNLYDGDSSTVWQPDRVLWRGGNENIIIDLKTVQNINKLVWVNGLANNTPTKFIVYSSLDGDKWREVAKVNSLQRIEDQKSQIVNFSQQAARYFKVIFKETLSGDSPLIAELWVVPTRFESLDILQAESFLTNPYAYIPNQEIFKLSLEASDYFGEAYLYWKSDYAIGWKNTKKAKLNLIYDNLWHEYNVIIPATGTKISELKLSDIQIPGVIETRDVNIDYLKINEL